MTEEIKKEEPKAPATTPPAEMKGLEAGSPEDLVKMYDKSPELFAKAGFVKKVEEKKPADASGAETKATEGDAQPEALDLKLPEGMPVDETALKQFRAIMGDKKLNNTQKAQKILDAQHEAYKREAEAAKSRDASYEKVLKDDPEFGAEFEANIEYAKQGLLKFDKSGALAKRLVEIGVNKDPVLTRYFRDVGKASGEGSTKRPPNGPNKEAETAQDQYKSRYNNSPGMFEGETTPNS